MKRYLLFDLDGTLTDPKIGITTCVQYALKDQGIDEPDLDKLEPFIGPPLQQSFEQFYQMDEEHAKQAVAKYRERFSDVGLFENEIYKGIASLLRTLKKKGFHLAVASSKPTVFVEKILEHFKIAQYFEAVVGSELDGRRSAKDEVVKEALSQLAKKAGVKSLPKDEIYMIGDRCFDVQGAKAMGVESVGVSYGYGSVEELMEAHADYVVQSVPELKDLLLREVMPSEEYYPSKLRRIWLVCYPILLFMLIRSIVIVVALQVLNMIKQSMPGTASFWVAQEENGQITALTGNANAFISMLGYIVATLVIWPLASTVIKDTASCHRLNHLRVIPTRKYLAMIPMNLGIVLGMNIILTLVQRYVQSGTYEKVAKNQYSAGILLGLLAYCIVAPIAEETVFRGCVYGYLRRFFGSNKAIFLSALIFGMYHGNWVQGVYACVCGAVFAFLYEYFGGAWVPVLLHVGANVLAYVLAGVVGEESMLLTWPMGIVCILLGGSCLYYIGKKPKRVKIIQAKEQ